MESVSDYLAICEKAIRVGGHVIRQWAGKFDVRKKGASDLVTAVDVASQQAISRTIREVFPDHCIIGEEDAQERSKADAPLMHCEYRWIIDPLDGTVNFVHGVPHYSVSLALERKGQLLAAAVLDPVLDECFTAAAGQGAWLNGQPIHTSNVTALSDALAAVGFPPGIKQDSPDLKVFLRMIFSCQAIRRLGSAALNLCYLAAGRYDVFWTFSTKIWDVAAGILLIREAGGAISTPEGENYTLDQESFLAAANPALLAQLQAVVAEALN
ncbi:MAG TPA: inositol monophosphatase family protein [Thermoguttaceae bacterium]